MDLYEYKPLESDTTIRVLVLGPSTDCNKPLDCRITHLDRASLWTTLGDGSEPSTTSFEAVSYAWGNPDFSEVLLLDNSLYLRITPNVKAMLSSFRHKTKTRRLWIDAICLNQADKDEKAVQIQLMGDIYRQAAKVRIWLGAADSTIPHVFAALQSLAGRGLPDGTLNTLVASQGPNTMAYLDSFLRRSWFSRRWIIQEVAVSHARTVHCGRYKIPWDWMADAFEVLLAGWGVRENPSPAAAVKAALWSAITIRKRSPEMLTLLWEFDKSSCSDRHDHIFALLGLARDVSGVKATGAVGNPGDERAHMDRDVVVAITYDIPWTTTYTLLAQSFIGHGHYKQLLEHLLAFGGLHNEDTGLPSWVPNWNRARQFSVPNVSWDPDYYSYESFLQLPENREDKRIILDRWYRYSPVRRSSGIIEELEARVVAGEGLKKWDRRPDSGRHHIGWLLFGSIDGGLFTSVDRQEFRSDFWLPYKGFLYPELIDAFREFEPKWPYRFLHLDGGATALARNTAQLGDLVICQHPALMHQVRTTSKYQGRHAVDFGLVLRPTEKDPETYRLIGPCFVFPNSIGQYTTLPRADSGTKYFIA